MYRYLIFILLLSFPAASAQSPVRVVIPGPTPPFIVRNPFVEDLIKLIFSKQNLQLNLVYASEKITQGRALKELHDTDIIDLTWSVSTTERERELQPIRFPIYQGYIGWRVFIINKENQKIYNEISSLSQLKTKLAVQRFDWPDYQVFIENKLPVHGDMPFSKMFKAIESGLADYFPRSVMEATRELKSYKSKQLAIEKTLLLKYPSKYYFFVANNKPELATVIKTGFELILADGSYQILFQQHFGSTLEALNLNERRVFNLRNPLQSIE